MPTGSKRNTKADTTEADRVYRSLRGHIVSGALAPGAVLRQEEIARRYDASRTPVREAVARLAAEGLVDASSRGASVMQLSIQDFVEINQLRLLLEPYAASVAAETMPDAEIARLEERLSNVSGIDAISSLDQDLHHTLAHYSRNARVSRMIDELNTCMGIARVHDLQGRHGEVRDDLEAIIGALRARDGELAAALMREHIQDFYSLIAPRPGSRTGSSLPSV